MLMELLIATDAAKRASARSITAVITHYGYARQDRKAGPREPITARLVANLLERAGVDRIITLDLHQGQIQGFFDIPVNHLSALPLFGQYYNAMNFDTDNLVVVSPDDGSRQGRQEAVRYARLRPGHRHKGRPRHNAAEVMGIIGDIKGKDLHHQRRHDRHRWHPVRQRQGAQRLWALATSTSAPPTASSPVRPSSV